MKPIAWLPMVLKQGKLLMLFFLWMGGILLSTVSWGYGRLTPGVYELSKDPQYRTQDSGIFFDVSYSVGISSGTHRGEVSDIESRIVIDKDSGVSSALFRTDVFALLTDKGESALRDCHMRQALSLNYGPGSRSLYPNEDVCDEQNSLPLSGLNAPVHRNIEVALLSLLDETNQERRFYGFLSGQTYYRTAKLQITIHGITRVEKAEVIIEVLSVSLIRLKLKSPLILSLTNYDIVVRKPFSFMSVKDQIKVNLNVVLNAK